MKRIQIRFISLISETFFKRNRLTLAGTLPPPSKTKSNSRHFYSLPTSLYKGRIPDKLRGTIHGSSHHRCLVSKDEGDGAVLGVFFTKGGWEHLLEWGLGGFRGMVSQDYLCLIFLYFSYCYDICILTILDVAYQILWGNPV